AWLEQRRLVGQAAQGIAVAGAQRKGHRQAGAMQDVQQVDHEGQLVMGAALDQGEDEFTLFQADEAVVVLGAFGDAVVLHQAAQLVGRQKVLEFGTFQRGEYGHGGYQRKISQAGMSRSGLSARTNSSPSDRTR